MSSRSRMVSIVLSVAAIGAFLAGGFGGVLPDAAKPALAYDHDSDDDSSDDSSDDRRVQRAPMQFFDSAGSVGGGPLNKGDEFHPSDEVKALLKRTSKCLSYKIKTDNLPEGAYTNWWLVWDKPETCMIPYACGFDDFVNPNLSTFWATGGVVGPGGVGRFQDRTCIGDDAGFPANQAIPPLVDALQNLQGPGMSNPKGATVWLIVKYHGLASDDAGAFYHQTHSLLGACFEGANAKTFPGFGVQCFDPQFAVFVAE